MLPDDVRTSRHGKRRTTTQVGDVGIGQGLGFETHLRLFVRSVLLAVNNGNNTVPFIGQAPSNRDLGLGRANHETYGSNRNDGGHESTNPCISHNNIPQLVRVPGSSTALRSPCHETDRRYKKPDGKKSAVSGKPASDRALTLGCVSQVVTARGGTMLKSA